MHYCPMYIMYHVLRIKSLITNFILNVEYNDPCPFLGNVNLRENVKGQRTIFRCVIPAHKCTKHIMFDAEPRQHFSSYGCNAGRYAPQTNLFRGIPNMHMYTSNRICVNFRAYFQQP